MKANRKRIFIPVVILVLSLGAGVQAATVPQLALGGGVECVLIVSNQSGAGWNGTVTLRQGNDEAWGTSWGLNGADRTGGTAFDIALGPKATAKFVLTGDSVARAGYLEIVAQDGSTIRDILISFFYNVRGGSGELTDSTGTPVLEAATRFGFSVEKQAKVDTGFALAPFSVVDLFDIVLTLYDSDGNQVQQQTLTYEGHLPRFFTNIFENIPEGFTGWVLVTAKESIFLTVLRLELPTGGLQLTSVPPQILLQIGSGAFAQSEAIPVRYTCDGDRLSPPLHWTRAPEGTVSWVLIVDDPDAPAGTFVHWIVFNIPATALQLASGIIPGEAVQGRNDVGNNFYGPPCPPAGPPHRYFFRLYALDMELNLPAGASRQQVEEAMEGHILGTAQLMGLYGR